MRLPSEMGGRVNRRFTTASNANRVLLPLKRGVACHYIHFCSKAYTFLADYTEYTIYEYYMPDCLRARESPMPPWEMNEYEKLQSYLRPPERR